MWDREGDVVISSSRSGEGEAFRFFERAVPDTRVAVSTAANRSRMQAKLT